VRARCGSRRIRPCFVRSCPGGRFNRLEASLCGNLSSPMANAIDPPEMIWENAVGKRAGRVARLGKSAANEAALGLRSPPAPKDGPFTHGSPRLIEGGSPRPLARRIGGDLLDPVIGVVHGSSRRGPPNHFRNAAITLAEKRISACRENATGPAGRAWMTGAEPFEAHIASSTGPLRPSPESSKYPPSRFAGENIGVLYRRRVRQLVEPRAPPPNCPDSQEVANPGRSKA